MQDLTLTIVQESLLWQQPQANRDRFEKLLEKEAQGSDLIVLPEMFTTGFDLSSTAQAEPMTGPTVQWLKAQAAKLHADITGSVMIEEGGRYFNRLLWVRPDGTVHSYDKRHLFSFGGEDKLYTAGNRRLVVDCKGWRCCPLVCYDLRFPVWSRNRNDYDLLLYVANWPKVRINHWSSLLVARAIENMSYVAGVNRIGDDGKGTAHNGQSVVLSPKGKPMVEPGTRAGCYTVTLDPWQLQRYRNKFRALDDADDFVIR